MGGWSPSPYCLLVEGESPSLWSPGSRICQVENVSPPCGLAVRTEGAEQMLVERFFAPTSPATSVSMGGGGGGRSATWLPTGQGSRALPERPHPFLGVALSPQRKHWVTWPFVERWGCLHGALKMWGLHASRVGPSPSTCLEPGAPLLLWAPPWVPRLGPRCLPRGASHRWGQRMFRDE